MPMENVEQPTQDTQKSSMEILSELFGSFDADPPVIVKKEKGEDKKHKKSKKKHKHKEKKHKKKSKKRKRSDSECSDNSGIDITGLLIKKEKDIDIKIEKDIEEKCSSIYDATILAIKGKEMIEIEPKPKKEKVNHKKDSSKDCNKKKKRSKSQDDVKRGRSKERYRLRSRSRSIERKSNKRKREKYSPRRDRKDYEKKRSFYDDFYGKDDKYSKTHHHRSYSEKEKRPNRDETSLSSHIDKKKLLEIARKNAIQMMKSGSLPGALTLGPQAQEKVIAAIKSGGKTVEELTDFCKTLSQKEELGELSSVSEDNDTDSDSDKQFHHPFLIKERPISITMNIKNSVPLPIKNSQERASELRIQFPVSSGQQHRKTESEWVPVSPKKTESTTTTTTTTITIASVSSSNISKPTPPKTTIVQKPKETLTQPEVFVNNTQMEQNIDVASIVSQRLSAMRKLQENPHDVQALTSMYKAQKEMNSWAESKQQIGQFTGSTGAQILSQAELSSGYQAWARKDQLQTAAPVSGGMGMHLLQKMGWRPGEGLGKEKSGTLEPLLLEVKLDKKGIIAKEDHQKRKSIKNVPSKGGGASSSQVVLQGKHPVSLLGEYACKNKLGIPQYDLCFECGPDHKKNFLFRVILNNIEYKPQIASPTKKEAKANAALVCLQQLGIYPNQMVQQPEIIVQNPQILSQDPQLLMHQPQQHFQIE
ncbi:protein Son [Onthophagus taurus]|uniref:protein Son n=1 Tax=Onthophagus taurus TaxID=166361 RepID=UPI0039BDCD25